MADRSFLVGETVNLRLTVSWPGTRNPADPTLGCRLVAISRGGTPVVVTPTEFTKASDGQYVLALDTTTLLPGAYTWRAEARESPSAVALAEDTFVLHAPQAVAP